MSSDFLLMRVSFHQSVWSSLRKAGPERQLSAGEGARFAENYLKRRSEASVLDMCFTRVGINCKCRLSSFTRHGGGVFRIKSCNESRSVRPRALVDLGSVRTAMSHSIPGHNSLDPMAQQMDTSRYDNGYMIPSPCCNPGVNLPP